LQGGLVAMDEEDENGDEDHHHHHHSTPNHRCRQLLAGLTWGATGRGNSYKMATTTLPSMTQDHRATRPMRTMRLTTTRTRTGIRQQLGGQGQQ
jgi:hypothetical protein